MASIQHSTKYTYEFCCYSFPVANCGPLTSPDNGDVDTSSGITAGSVALYSCDQGLVLTGSAARVCGNDGLWIPAPPTCEGARLYLIFCTEIFVSVGDLLIMNAPILIATPVQCGQLINPTNGQVTVSGTIEGSTASYTCNEGFTLSGSTSRTCGSDGAWRPAAPICRMYCDHDLSVDYILKL